MSEAADKKQFLGLKGVKTLLDGLKGEYSPLGHKHDTSEIDGYVEPVQSKWTQNDKTSADYIVDRTHYHTPLTQNTEYGYLESPTVGIHLLQDLTGEYPYVLNVLKAENIARKFNETNYHFRLDVGMILSDGTVSNLISNDNITSNAEMLDDINYKSQINESGINIYFILDLSTLSEENKVKFTVLGIYLELESETALGKLEWIKSQILSYVTLDTNYLDRNIATKTYVDDAKTATINDILNTSYNQIVMTDTINGYQYIMQMREGKLISYCIASSITVTTLPSKLEYVVGEIFDATGMIVTAICQDGSSREITGYTYSDNTLNLDDTSVEISYTENGQTFTTTIAITVTEVISTEENTETIE